ncbi:MAG: UvrD-helicase domain-containing protein [Gemmiger formicilis]|jgi:DNA helicase-2/ATP-dependent DNA helicase PcrA|uniref:UvrD-helicase domain-containing protein n=1 Tax=Gemmiger formicilis TaxID=745368 RepID=UPI003996896C
MIDYKKLKISDTNRIKEQQIIDRIGQCIDDGFSWIFNAGAGSGKTYALVQSLKMLLDKKGPQFYIHGQKVLCITYTNAAADEIKERLGNTPLVLVSTIHERMWEIIGPYKDQLMKLHRTKLREAIIEKKEQLQEQSWAQAYRNLSEQQKNELLEKINSEHVRDVFFQVCNSKAQTVRAAFPEIAEEFPGLMKNIGNFTKIIRCLYSINSLAKALDKTKRKTCPKVKYDPRLNTDRLSKMLISHDTLLEYSYLLISRNERLKQIICDKYPAVFVDEFQDTNPMVVKTISSIHHHALKIGHSFLVGYYGDIRQNIYDRGVGAKIFQLHKGLTPIQKEFNRRSSPKIIGVANLIRNDGLIQQSIYEKFPTSEVLCEVCPATARDEIVEKLCDRWKISIDNPLHCFELTNELVAKKSGFEDIYDFFKNCRYYKRGRNYELLRDHLLAQDETKLGDVQKLLFRLLDFKKKVQNDKTSINNLLQISRVHPDTKSKFNIINIRALVDKLHSLSGETLASYLEKLFEFYQLGDDLYDECIRYTIAEEIDSLVSLKQYMLECLFVNADDAVLTDLELQDSSTSIDNFLNIKMDIFECWYDFINRTDKKSDIIYHTFHSTKGLEFDNVLILLTKKFGRDKEYFSSLLKTFPEKTDAKYDSTEIGAARNLFYVAVTRATKKLCVAYLADEQEQLSDVELQLGSIFTKVNSLT